MINKSIHLSQAPLSEVLPHSYQMAILPWGATEPHNLHLPYLTDSILSHQIALLGATKALLSDVRVMVLPSVNLGSQNPGQRSQPFCIHASYQTQYAILCDIVDSLAAQGVDKLLILNGHGGNNFKNMVRDLAVSQPCFTIACAEWYRLVPEKDFFEHPGDHAGDLETSVMMYLFPELVDLSKAGTGETSGFSIDALNKGIVWIPRDWSKISKDTGVGNPLSATSEKGEAFTQAVVDQLAQVLIDISTKPLYK